MDKINEAIKRMDEIQCEPEIMAGIAFVMFDSLAEGCCSKNSDAYVWTMHELSARLEDFKNSFKEILELLLEGTREAKKGEVKV